MEIKTTTEIYNDCIDGITHNSVNEDMEKRWISIDSLLEIMKKKTKRK